MNSCCDALSIGSYMLPAPTMTPPLIVLPMSESMPLSALDGWARLIAVPPLKTMEPLESMPSPSPPAMFLTDEKR